MRQWICLLLALAMLLPAAGFAKAQEAQARKVVYLTFDDGPKKDTPELLALLDELNVPATFFLMGLSIEAFPEHARMIAEAGHAIGCHTMTHSYKRLKESVDYVGRDIKRFENTMREHVDPAFTTDLYRFPGGSSSYTSRTKAYVRDLGYAWFDWNAMNGDAHYTFDSDAQMYRYTLSTIGEDEHVVILLMHEGKARTRRVLVDLVAYFKENGFEFRMLSTSEEDRAILSACPARMMLPDAGQTPDAQAIPDME